VGSQVTNDTYDANGNLTSESTGLDSSFSYNAKNQTTAIASDSFTYTGPSQTERVQAVTSAGTLNFVTSGLGISSRTGPNGTTYYRRCSCGQLLDEVLPNGSRYYYLFDAQGSVVGLMNGQGQMVNGYAYDPFGNSLFERTQQANPFQFDSGYLDNDTGLYKFITRYYDPTVGRWTQHDSIAGSLASPDSLNHYLYVGDDPVNAVDPSGENPLICGLTIALAFTIGLAGLAGVVHAIITAPAFAPIAATTAATAFLIPTELGIGIERSRILVLLSV
jgi:RHS repeat-associated protein